MKLKIKTNTSGFGHLEMLFLVLAVVIIGTVGFFVYQNQNKKTASKATAHAGSYTTIGTGRGITISACKTYNSVYGGIYTVKVLFAKAATTPAYTYDVFDQNGITGAFSQETKSNAYYAGTVAAVVINMSVVNKDILGWSEYGLLGGGITTPQNTNANVTNTIAIENGLAPNFSVNAITNC